MNRILISLLDLGADLVGAFVLDEFVDPEHGARGDKGDGRPADDAADQARDAKPADKEGDELAHAGAWPIAAASLLALRLAYQRYPALPSSSTALRTASTKTTFMMNSLP
ncbi:hypothetical protein [Mesorhizobium sp. NZP2234]|uniref:hypothetical protein n=1 Tax=Mesorhizobium sp. NZP2234 TaxID=2483402 RepID=UPI001FEED90D|nr:hypothetical protein [Mesorhizobium sp. NZP2234]